LKFSYSIASDTVHFLYSIASCAVLPPVNRRCIPIYTVSLPVQHRFLYSIASCTASFPAQYRFWCSMASCTISLGTQPKHHVDLDRFLQRLRLLKLCRKGNSKGSCNCRVLPRPQREPPRKRSRLGLFDQAGDNSPDSHGSDGKRQNVRLMIKEATILEQSPSIALNHRDSKTSQIDPRKTSKIDTPIAIGPHRILEVKLI